MGEHYPGTRDPIVRKMEHVDLNGGITLSRRP